jgi:hypothetical protein
MNNNITEDYCSPKVSSLLEEKGMARGAWLVPTQALAIKWIRENFGIHIWLENNAFGYYWKTNNSSNPKFWDKDFRAFQGGTDMNTIHPPEKEYKEPEEAIEAALLYTLKHLI